MKALNRSKRSAPVPTPAPAPTPGELPPGARGLMAPRPAATKTAEPESVADLFDKALDDVTKK